jgi:hypothetical protein
MMISPKEQSAITVSSHKKAPTLDSQLFVPLLSSSELWVLLYKHVQSLPMLLYIYVFNHPLEKPLGVQRVLLFYFSLSLSTS